MNKSILITGFALALATSAHSQTLIAGFDFENSTNANYSDLGLGGLVNDGAAANVYGSFSYQDGAGNPFAQTQLFPGDIDAGNILFSSIRVPGFNDSFDTDGTGGLIAEDIGFATADGGFFDFTISAGSVFEDFQFGFAAGQQQAGTTLLAVSYSINGGSSFNLLENVSVTSLTSAGGQAYNIDASGFSASDVIFRVGFTDVAIGVLFDNIQVAGTAVPEPSSFAAIAGVLAIAFVGSRRRR